MSALVRPVDWEPIRAMLEIVGFGGNVGLAFDADWAMLAGVAAADVGACRRLGHIQAQAGRVVGWSGRW